MIVYEVGEISKHGMHFVCGLNLPTIKYGKEEYNDFCENYRRIGFKLDTEFMLTISEDFKYFGFSILGFGIYWSIQTGY